MESDLGNKSTPDCTGNIKCPMQSEVINQRPETQNDDKPQTENQELHNAPAITKTGDDPSESASKPSHEHKKYHNISNDIRMKLINAVENQGEKIKHAASRLDINYSSAKSICQVFKREGRMNKKSYKTRNQKGDQSTTPGDLSLKTEEKNGFSKPILQTNSDEMQEPPVQKKVQTTSFNTSGLQLVATSNQVPSENFSKIITGYINGSNVVYQDYQKSNAGSFPSSQPAIVKFVKPGEFVNTQQSQSPIIYMNINGTINGMNDFNGTATNGMNNVNGMTASTQFNFTNAPGQVSSGFQSYGIGQFNGHQVAYPIYYTANNQGNSNGYPVFMQSATINNFTTQNQQQVIMQQPQTQQLQTSQLSQPIQSVVYLVPTSPHIQYVPQNYFEGANFTTISTSFGNNPMSSNSNNTQSTNGSYFNLPKKNEISEKFEATSVSQMNDERNSKSMKISTE